MCLIKELGLGEISGNPTYIKSNFEREEIISNHKSFMTSLHIPTTVDDNNLPILHWIPKLHKTPYKARFIAGSSTCTTKALSKTLTTILSAVKDGLAKYYDTVFSRSGINQMWILRNSKELLDNLKFRSLPDITSIQTFDFSTLYYNTTR